MKIVSNVLDRVRMRKQNRRSADRRNRLAQWEGLQAMEPRLLLSVTAVDDIGVYDTDEDTPLSTALSIATGGPNGTVWSYLDDGTDQGTAWRQLGFDDDAWATGTGTFGYPAPRNTILSFGPNSAAKYPTYYFRYEFNTSDFGLTTQEQLDAIAGAEIVTQYDDGFAMYLNGVRIDGINVNVDAPFSEFATANQNATKTTALPGNPGLVLGDNVLAVEIKQENGGSSDILFNTDFRVSTSPTGTILENDDLSGLNGTLVITKLTDPVDSIMGTPAGTVVIHPVTGDFLFTPAANYFGTAVFTYSIDDDDLNPSIGTVEVTVNSINDLPPNPTNDSYFANEGQTINAGDVAVPPLVSVNQSYNFLAIPVGAGYPTDDDTLAWNHPDFDIATSSVGTWSTGNGPFAQGTIDYYAPNGLTPTALPGSAADDFRTYVFRTTFDAPNGSLIDAIDISILADDGAIIYINGEEVARVNMPGGAVTADTFASGVGPENAVTTLFGVPVTGILIDGINTVAVELHNDSAGSSDVGLLLEIKEAENVPVIVPLASTWRFLDSLPRTSATYPVDAELDAWNSLAFNPATSSIGTWGTGAGPFAGGGINYANANPPFTSLAVAPATITTYLFRQVVNIADGSGIAALDLRLLADDGAVVYVNGTEVARLNMAAGPVTPASFTNGAAAGNEDSLTAINNVNVLGLMLDGDNVIAVEVHQNSLTSSDIGFEMEVRARYGGNASVLANDNTFDVEDGNNVIAVLVDSSEVDAVGTLTFNADGTFMFVPDSSNLSGTFRFTYVLEDTEGGQSAIPATVTLTLRPGDDGPVVAVDDIGVAEFTVAEDGSLVINAGNTPAPVADSVGIGILANDTTDPQDVNDPVTIIITDSSNLNGSLVLHAATGGGHTGGFTYTPTANFNGTASFKYVVNDGFTNSNEATVEIEVTPVDDPPIANNDAYTVAEDGTLVVNVVQHPAPQVYLGVNASWRYLDQMDNTETYPLDLDNLLAWYETGFLTSESDPAIGTWLTANGPFQQGGINGLTALSPTTLAGAPATHTTYLFRATFNVANGASVNTLNLRSLFDDGAVVYINGEEVLRVNMPAFPTPITSTTFATATGDEDNFADRFVNVSGILVDGDNVIAVELHNQSATSSDIGFGMQIIEVLVGLEGVAANDVDVDGTGFTVDTTPIAGRGPKNGSLTLNADGTFTYTPFPNFSGTDKFEYTINSSSGSDTAVVTITVTPSNDAPVGVNDTYTMDQDTVLVVSQARYANDGGTVVLPAGSVWKYLDDGSDQGTAWRASGFDDLSWASGPAQLGYGDGDEATVVSFGGDAANKHITTYFRTTFDLAGAGLTAAEVDSFIIHVLADDGAAVYVNGVEAVRLNLLPGAAFNQEAGVVDAGVGEGVFVSFLVDGSLLVDGINSVAAEVHQVERGSSDVSFDMRITVPTAPFGVLANDSDPDGNAITAVLVSGPVDESDNPVGILNLNADGTFTYTPDAGFSGTVTFTYQADDGLAPGAGGGSVLSNLVTVTIIVTSTGIPGDFNNDSVVDVADVDLLCGEVRAGTHSSAFDLNGDSLVNLADRDYLIQTILGTRPGDTNLDRDVDISDLSRLATFFGLTGGASWGQGNFDCDLDVDITDLSALATFFGFVGPPPAPVAGGSGGGGGSATSGQVVVAPSNSGGSASGSSSWGHIRNVLDGDDEVRLV